MKTGKQSTQGFTLIELMIVVGIIGILGVIAYPSYVRYVQNARQSDMQGVLIDFASDLEGYRAQNFSYKDAGTTLTTPTNEFYDVSLSVDGDNRGYTLLAKPKGGQAGTGAIAINEAGQTCLNESNDSTCSPGTNPW